MNHGVAREVMQGMKDASVRFFELLLEDKNKISMPPDDIQGYGHAYLVSEAQILDWSDTLILLVYPSRFRKLGIWPTKPKGFVYATEFIYNQEKKKTKCTAIHHLTSLKLNCHMTKSKKLSGNSNLLSRMCLLHHQM